jgi:hypothetical protein
MLMYCAAPFLVIVPSDKPALSTTIVEPESAIDDDDEPVQFDTDNLALKADLNPTPKPEPISQPDT